MFHTNNLFQEVICYCLQSDSKNVLTPSKSIKRKCHTPYPKTFTRLFQLKICRKIINDIHWPVKHFSYEKKAVEEKGLCQKWIPTHNIYLVQTSFLAKKMQVCFYGDLTGQKTQRQ